MTDSFFKSSFLTVVFEATIFVRQCEVTRKLKSAVSRRPVRIALQGLFSITVFFNMSGGRGAFSFLLSILLQQSSSAFSTSSFPAAPQRWQRMTQSSSRISRLATVATTSPLNDTQAASTPRLRLHSALPLLGQRLEEFDPAIIRCPFFRRRATDFLEGAVLCGRWLASRHKSLDLSFGLLPQRQSFVGCDSTTSGSFAQAKVQDVTCEQVLAQLAEDFVTRQCQVTGRLSRAWYAEDCRFDGPDPDMPVVGLGKYLAASTNLFCHAASRCDLLGVGYIQHDDDTFGFDEVAVRGDASEPGGDFGGMLVVLWRIEGTVNLPWQPTIKPYHGATFFQRAPNTGLLVEAHEYWSISALDAFASAAPGLAGLGEPPAPPAPDLLAVHAAMVAAATNTAAHYEARSGEPFDATGLVSAVGTALLRSLRGVPPELIARTRFLAVPIRPVAAEIMREGEKEAALTATPL